MRLYQCAILDVIHSVKPAFEIDLLSWVVGCNAIVVGYSLGSELPEEGKRTFGVDCRQGARAYNAISRHSYASLQSFDGICCSRIPCPVYEHISNGLVADLVCLAFVPKQDLEDVHPLLVGDILQVVRSLLLPIHAAKGGEGHPLAGVASSVVLIVGKSPLPSEDKGDEFFVVCHNFRKFVMSNGGVTIR